MQAGGGQGGFVATQDTTRSSPEFPLRLYGVTATVVDGEYGFGEVFFERTSYASREKAKDFLGTGVGPVDGIGAGVYLSLMGPQGMGDRREHRALALRRQEARRPPGRQGHALAALLQGVRGQLRRHGQDAWPRSTRPCSAARSSAARTSPRVPELGQSALYCVTEVHTRATSTRSSAHQGDPLSRQQLKTAAEEKVAGLAKSAATAACCTTTIRLAGTSRFIFELSTPGVRGILPPDRRRSDRRGRRRGRQAARRHPAPPPPSCPRSTRSACCATSCTSRRRRWASTSTPT